MRKMYITVGLPASGKTTWAKNQDANIICRDDARKFLFAPSEDWDWRKYKFTRAREKRVTDLVDQWFAFECNELLSNVIISDTNLNPTFREQWVQRGEAAGFEVIIKNFDTPVHTCLERDGIRGKQAVGRQVILDMFNKYICEPAPDLIPGVQTAIMVDVDGTLAHMHNRGPFDWAKVGDDLPDAQVISMVDYYRAKGYVIIVCTGRDGCALQDTKDWLSKHNVNYDRIYIRPEGDTRCDVIIKREIYEEHVKDYYNVELVLDDRERVVYEWRRLGLKCLQVANGCF